MMKNNNGSETNEGEANMTTTTIEGKTLEQLQMEAAEAQKTIDALKQKQQEIATATKTAQKEAKLVAQKTAATATLLTSIQTYGPKMKLIAASKMWKGISSFCEHSHGEENKPSIDQHEKDYGFMRYRATIGKCQIDLNSFPTSWKGNDWHGHRVVVGEVRLTVTDQNYKTSKHTYKTFKAADEKIYTILEKIALEQEATEKKADNRAGRLEDIKTVAMARFPECKHVEVSYEYVPKSDRSGGYRESDMVRLETRSTKEDYSSGKQYANVQIDAEGNLTATFIRREKI